MAIRIRTIGRFLGRTLGVLLLVLIILLILLRVPYIQTQIAKVVTTKLSKQTGSRIDIDRICINFTDQVTLKGLYVEDQANDTLLYAGNLSVDITLWRLLSREISVDRIELEHSTIHLKQAEDRSFNFQFLVDSFSKPNQPKKENPKPFAIDVDKVVVKDLFATTDLIQGDNRIHLPELEVDVKSIDLAKNSFNVKSIRIAGLTGSSIWQARKRKVRTTPRQPLDKFPLANIGVSIQCDELDILDADLLYQQGDPSQKETFNSRNIHGRGLQLSLRNIKLDESAVSTDIKQIHLEVNDQVLLDEFSTRAVFGADRSTVEDLQLVFNSSRIELNAEAVYPEFKQLIKLNRDMPVDVNISQLNVAPADVQYFLPVLGELAILKPFMDHQLYAEIEAIGTLGSLVVKESEIRTGEHTVDLSGTFANITNPRSLKVQGGAFDIRSTTKLIQAMTGEQFPAEIGDRFNKLHVDGKVNGSLANMDIKQLNIRTDGLLQANLSGKLLDLTQMDRMRFDLKIGNLRTGYEDLVAMTDSLPELLKDLDTIRFAGNVSGGIRDFMLDGTLKTPIGQMTTDASIAFNSDYSDASYSGDIRLEEFNAGQMLSIDSLGIVSFKASLDGKGLSPDSINTGLVFELIEATFNGYTYSDFKLDGRLEGRQFTGNAKMNDEFAQFDFEGTINLNDSIPDVNFAMNIDHLDLGALHFSRDSLQISAQIDADVKGFQPDLMDGSVSISDMDLRLNQRTWSADTIIVSADKDFMGVREILLQSPVADASIYGNFSFSRMVPMVMNFSRDYFDVRNIFADSVMLYEEGTIINQFIEVNASIGDLVPLSDFFGIGITQLDTAYLHFLLDESRNDLDLMAIVPAFEMDGMSADSIILIGYNSEDELSVNMNTGRLTLSEGIYLPGLSIDMLAGNQLADLSLIIKNETDSGFNRLQLLTAMEVVEDHIRISVEDPFILNSKEWYADQSGPIEVYADRTIFPQLILQSEMEAVRMVGKEETVEVDLVNFDVANLLDLIDIGDWKVNGIMDGRFDIGLTKDQPIAIGELDIWAITVDDNLVGDLTLWAGARGDQAWGTMNFSGFENEMSVEATYDLLSRELDGEVIMESLHIKPFEPFFSEFARDATGELSGSVRLQGTIQKPALQGKISFKEVSAFVLPAQTRYTIGSGTLDVNSKLITPTIILLDADKRTAELTGQIHHDNFSNMRFDLRLFSNKFTFLDSKPTDDDLYYGKFVGMVDAFITGNPSLPIIRASVATKNETDITVQLLSKKAVMNQESYILFYDGKQNYSQNQLDSLAIVRYNVNTGIDLTLNASISENSIFRLVIDPITGDNLEIQGNADLLVRIPDKGDLSITGTYTVEEGNYRFSYQSLLRRNFGIVKGSRIIFTGDPMNALLDIQAAYSTKASAYSLVADNSGTLTEAEIRTLRRKSDVDVLLDITGKLASPELKFDLNLAAANEGAVGGTINRTLANVKQNESELNKQVFSLLLFNSFTGISATGSASTAGTGTAMRSVGSLINNQLNKLAQNAQGLEIDFDLDQYAGALSESKAGITEIDFGIRQSLFNDKLIIAVGSNIGLEGGSSSGKALSNVAGDFVLEYKISQGGKYRVKVFQKTDYDALNEDNVWKTGLGFSYQTTFGKQFLKSKRRGEK